MKKLLIFPGYYLPHLGGVESHVDELARRLSKKGFFITIFAPNIPKTKDYERISKDLRIIRYPAFEAITNFPLPKFWKKDFWKKLNELRKEKYDFVMSRTRFFFSSFIAYIFARLTKAKFIHAEHGSEHVKLGNPIKDFIALIYDYTLGFIVVNRADICIAVSKTAKKFTKRFRKRKIHIITRGVEFGFVDKIKENKGIRKKYKNKIVIGFVGRLIHWKGLQNALLGFQSLEEEIKKKCVFLIVGGGPDFKKLKKQFESKNIVFLGQKKRNEAVSLMKSFDIYIHSTISGGGLSNSLLEAMSTNNAIIATEAEGAKEILDKHNAIVIKKSIPSLFKIALTKMVENNELRAKLSKKADAAVRKKFRWEDKIKEYIKLLENRNI